MKVHEKKKAFRRMCKELVKAGKVNTPDGAWKNNTGEGAMQRDQRAGHRV